MSLPLLCKQKYHIGHDIHYLYLLDNNGFLSFALDSLLLGPSPGLVPDITKMTDYMAVKVYYNNSFVDKCIYKCVLHRNISPTTTINATINVHKMVVIANIKTMEDALEFLKVIPNDNVEIPQKAILYKGLYVLDYDHFFSVYNSTSQRRFVYKGSQSFAIDPKERFDIIATGNIHFDVDLENISYDDLLVDYRTTYIPDPNDVRFYDCRLRSRDPIRWVRASDHERIFNLSLQVDDSKIGFKFVDVDTGRTYMYDTRMLKELLPYMIHGHVNMLMRYRVLTTVGNHLRVLPIPITDQKDYTVCLTEE